MLRLHAMAQHKQTVGASQTATLQKVTRARPAQHDACTAACNGPCMPMPGWCSIEPPLQGSRRGGSGVEKGCLDGAEGELVGARGQREQRQDARLGQRGLRGGASGAQHLAVLLGKGPVLLQGSTGASAPWTSLSDASACATPQEGQSSLQACHQAARSFREAFRQPSLSAAAAWQLKRPFIRPQQCHARVCDRAPARWRW